MFQNLYRFNIYIFMFTNEIRPYESHADHRDKSCDARSISRMWVSSMLKPEDFMALKAVSISHRFLYVKIAPSGRLKHIRICNSGTPSEFLIRLPAR